jgi:hypothetical protein
MGYFFNVANFDFYAPSIEFMWKGRNTYTTFLGTFLSVSTIAVFMMFLVQFSLYYSKVFIDEQNILINNYTSKFIEYDYYSANRSMGSVRISTDPKNITNLISYNDIFRNENKYVNADVFIFGMMLLDTRVGQSMKINSNETKQFFTLKLYRYINTTTTIVNNSTSNNTNNNGTSNLNGTSDNGTNINNNKTNSTVANITTIVNTNYTEIRSFNFTNCEQFLNDKYNSSTNKDHKDKYKKIMINYPYLNKFECLNNFNFNFPVTSKKDITNYFKFSLELCYNKTECINYGYLYDQLKFYKLIYFHIDQDYGNKYNFTYYPHIKEVPLNINYKKSYFSYFYSNYFYDIPLNIVNYITVFPYLSTVDVSKSIINKNTIIGNTISNVNDNVLFELIFGFSFSVSNYSFSSQTLLVYIAILGNLLFLIFFVCRLIYKFLNVNGYLNQIMNDIMIIIDPKSKDTENSELMDQRKMSEQNIIVNKQEYLHYGGVAIKFKKHINKERRLGNMGNVLTSPRRDRDKEKEKDGRHRFVIPNRNVLAQMDNENQGKRKKKRNKEITKCEKILKKYEELIFNRMIYYNTNQNFKFNIGDVFNKHYYSVKTDLWNKGRKILFDNTNFSNVVLSLNTFRFMMTGFVLKEYQYFILSLMSSHTIVGEYVLGSSNERGDDIFYDQYKFEEKMSKLERAVKKFRKNKKFWKFDKKMLRLFKIIMKEEVVGDYIGYLKEYYKMSKVVDDEE